MRSKSATLNSTVSPNGTTPLTGASLCWGTAADLSGCTTISLSMSGWSATAVNPATANLTGLSPNSTYYYKVTTTWSTASSISSAPTSFTTGTIATSDPSNVSVNGATIQGLLTAGSAALANSSMTNVQLCYSTTSAVTNGLLSNSPQCGSSLWTGSSSVAAGNAGSFSRNLTGLDTNATYYYQIQATYNGGEAVYGAVKNFTTMNAPTATIDLPFQVTGRGAKIRGKVNPHGNSVNKVSFCFSTTPSISLASCTQSDVATSFITQTTSDNSTETTLSGLTPNTRYYYLIFAKTSNFLSASFKFKKASLSNALSPSGFNGGFKTAAVQTSDTVYSSTTSFTTAGTTTDSATSVAPTSAVLNGTLTASSTGFLNSDVTSVKLCYSTTNVLQNNLLKDSPVCSSSLWGSSSIAGTDPPSSLAFSSAISGLSQGTTYYEQIQVAFADGSTLEGAAVPFTTSSLQTATAVAADSITSTSAVIRGSVDAKGTALSSISFCYDTDSNFSNCSSNTFTLTAPVGGWSTGVNLISKSLSGLSTSQVYYFKVMTISDLGLVDSTSLNFKTNSVLSFDSQGGSSVSPIEFITGRTVSLSSSNTTWLGHTFLGWFEDPTTGSAVSTSYAVPGSTDKTLYAHWELTAYPVTFDENGGTLVTDQTYTIGGSITDPGSPTRDGYHFDGWFTADTNGTQYSFPAATTGTGPITVYANWTLEVYNVNFDSNGGSLVAGETYTINGKIVAPTPGSTLAGNRFLGWFDASNQLVDFANFPVAGTTGDITLTAHWQPYTVTYSYGSGSGTVPNSTTGVVASLPGQGGMVAPGTATFGGWKCGSGSALAEGTRYEPTGDVTCTAVWIASGSHTVTFNSNYPTKSNLSATQSDASEAFLDLNAFDETGYVFAYWCKTPGTTCVVGGRIADGASYLFDADLQLYAIWTLASYTITFDANDGTSGHDSGSYQYLATTAINHTPSFSRYGYTFTGWATSPSGTKLLSHQVLGSQTLFAVWTINTYTISYDANDGTSSITSSTEVYLANLPLADHSVSRTGYHFDGWGTSRSSRTALTSYSVTGNAFLFAIWTPLSYVISYDKNDGANSVDVVDQSYDFGNTTALDFSTGFNRSGYTFAGWTTAGSSRSILTAYEVTSAATLYALWSPASNTVIFDKRNGTPDYQSTFYTGGLITRPSITVVLAGNHFDGWFDVSEDGFDFDVAPGVIGTVTLHANWTPYIVTFLLGQGGGSNATGTAPDPMSGLIDHLPGQGDMLPPVGYTFTGWTCAGSTTVFVAGESITPTSNTTCTAKWSPIAARTITFHSNYPAGANATTVQSSLIQDLLNPNPFIAGGYHFGGWALSPTGQVAYQDRDSYDFVLSGDLYAVWVRNATTGGPSVYVINYEYRGGDGSVVVTYYTFGDPGVQLPTAVRPGFTFTGWSTDPNVIDPVTGPYTTSRNVILYATWKAKTFTVKFNYQGGTGTVTELTYTVGDAGFKLPGSTNQKLVFGGWSEVPGGSAAVQEPYVPTSDITLYAIWNGKKIIVTLDPV
ncbi:MAG: InlB B-repeat-containing protein, partial [Rhodoluna sp.]